MSESDQKQERKPVFENKINLEPDMDEILDLGGTHIRSMPSTGKKSWKFRKTSIRNGLTMIK